METQVQAIKDQIPIVHDGLSTIMLVGVAMGIYLSLTIAGNLKREKGPLLFFGLLIFSASLISLDIYLCYTGLMKHVLFLNDSTEFIALALGPFIYLFLHTALIEQKVKWRRQWVHFILPAVYFITQIGFMIESEAVKLNAYIAGFHPDLPFVKTQYNAFQPLYHFGKTNLHEAIILSYSFYTLLSFRLIRGRKNKTAVQHPLINKLAFSRNTIIVFAVLTLVLSVVFIAYDTDLGDPYFAIVFTLFVLMSNYFFSSSSGIFRQTWLNEKYHSSGMANSPGATLHEINAFINETGFAIQQQVTLKQLSDQMGMPSTYISQAINSELGINFNDFINQFRVQRAISYLQDPAYSHINIEGIGKSVGFKSKSAFYQAFRKVTGTTPSIYVKSKEKS